MRFRPILATSFAFVAGLVPLVMATGPGAIGNRTIGACALGGMLFGTIFGVIVVPGLYYVFGKIAEGRSPIRDEDEQPLTGRDGAPCVAFDLRSASEFCALLTSACIPRCRVAARAANTQLPGLGGVAGYQQLGPGGWREFFTDARLTALIDLALKNNQELNIVALEVDIAQNEVMARRGEYLPRVGIRAGAGIDKVSQYSSQGTADDVNGVSANLANFALGFTASWRSTSGRSCAMPRRLPCCAISPRPRAGSLPSLSRR